ncbi:MAG: hypothetical protein AB7S71_01020 [Dongiaceae bacterium]
MRENKHIGSALDDFLREEGVIEVFEARAIGEVITWQRRQAKKQRRLSSERAAWHG